MTPQYSRLPALFATGPQSTTTVPENNDYELGSLPRQDLERYEPFPKAHAPPVSPSLTECSRYMPPNDDVPVSKIPVLSTTRPTSKKAVASVTSLTSQNGRNHSSPVFRKSMMSWALELIAIVISIGSLLAIIAILRREDGRPLSSWTLAVSLNAVIATLGTLSRTTLAFALSACIGQQKWNWLAKRADCLMAWVRFDEASRGPWGATRLFIWLRARYGTSKFIVSAY
jgi:hypothetical protein